jgi:alpha-beta hydrolase superfamily lysophospholipase
MSTARFFKTVHWLRARWKRLATLCVLLLLVVPNVLAYRHARAMMHFTPAGTRTKRPEGLSAGEKVGVILNGVTIPRPENSVTPAQGGLPFEVHRFPSRDGIELEAWYVPRSPSRGLVLLFHGYASCKSLLISEAQAFRELGYATLLMDFRGSGGSSGDETSVGVYEADDVAAACDYARAHWPGEPLILYGQSMGSAAILRAVAVRGVEASALVLECPFDRLLSTVENRFTAMGVPAFPGARLLVFWGGVQCHFNGFGHNPADYARDVRVPTLMLHGARDPRVTTTQVEAVFANLAGPKQFELFPDVGHEAYVARNPVRWKTRVGEFLAGHP